MRPRAVVLPSRLKVALRWRKRAFVDGKEVSAWTYDRGADITVSTNQPRADQADSIIHEVLHTVRPRIPHRMIYRLAEGIIMWIRANPQLAEWIVHAAISGRYMPEEKHERDRKRRA